MPNIIYTNNGQDFSDVKPIIFVNPSGYSITNPTVKVIDTNNGQDFSSVKPIIFVNTSGIAI